MDKWMLRVDIEVGKRELDEKRVSREGKWMKLM